MRPAQPVALHQRFTPKPLALAAAMAIALAAGHAPLAHAQSGAAATAATPIAINIPAQPLAQALNELARQANLQMTFPAALVAGKQAPAVSGQLTVRQAADRLLAGSGLAASVEGTSVVVRQAPSGEEKTLATVTVTATGLRATTEGTDSYTTGETNTATRFDLSPRETPQSVSVITRTQMDDFGVTDVDDALASTTGVTVEQVETDRTYYTARGFDITNFQVDGVGVPFVYGNVYGNLDTAFYDRIEVLRGGTGLMAGMSDPSATINFVRKRPTREWQAAAGAMVGSWNNRRVDADVSGALTEAGGRARPRRCRASGQGVLS